MSLLKAFRVHVDPPIGELGAIWHEPLVECSDWVVVGPHMLMSGWTGARSNSLATVIEYTQLAVLQDLGWHLAEDCNQ